MQRSAKPSVNNHRNTYQQMKAMKQFLSALVLFTAAVFPAHAAEKRRSTPPWPPAETRPIRVIIDADAANEIDDQFALALALGNRDRLKIEGIVAAHFGDAGGPDGIDKSFAEVERVLKLAGMEGQIPVKRGADPLTYIGRPPTSEGVDFIIERAKASTPDDPLWLILLGPATDGVAALLSDPSIADRLIIFWHGRSAWPDECLNFNAKNDAKAARLCFSLPCRFVLFDTGTHLTMPKEETEQRLAPLGPLGSYLHEIRSQKRWASPTKGIFDLGDIAALVDPSSVKYEEVDAPTVTDGMRYDFKKTQGEIVRIHTVDRDRSFQLLEEALVRLHEPKKN